MVDFSKRINKKPMFRAPKATAAIIASAAGEHGGKLHADTIKAILTGKHSPAANPDGAAVTPGAEAVPVKVTPYVDVTDAAAAIAEVMRIGVNSLPVPVKPLAAPVKPVKEEPVILSAQQEKVWEKIKLGRNVLVTGAAGTGKSTILKKMRETYGPRGLAVVASTGIAAVNVGGMTINSWAGLGLANEPAKTIAERIIYMPNPKVRDRIRACVRLAIDEVSMISATLLNLIDEVFRLVRESHAVFGGVQIIFFGDFLQLPPVIKDMEKPKDGVFAFQAQSWKNANVAVAMLTQVFRQKDAAFSKALNDIRIGNYTEAASALLRARYKAVDPDPTIKPVIIHTHNADVDAMNGAELLMIKEEPETYTATDSGQGAALTTIQNNCLAPASLVIKVGAQVMLLWNVDPVKGLANGSVGIVISIGKHSRLPTVKFTNGQELEVEPQTWEITEEGKVLAARKQIPLRLAWAITCHKSQGMTLDKAELHLEHCFENGQAYVALSRVRTMDGLFIVSGSKASIKAHPAAVAFYQTAESVL